MDDESEIVKLRAALETVKAYLPSPEEQVYGHYVGGDPRNFIPDRECCTEEELTAWKAACDAANAGLPYEAEGHGHDIERIDIDGKPHLVIQSKPGSFGVGARIVHDAELALIHAIIDEALRP